MYHLTRTELVPLFVSCTEGIRPEIVVQMLKEQDVTTSWIKNIRLHNAAFLYCDSIPGVIIITIWLLVRFLSQPILSLSEEEP